MGRFITAKFTSVCAGTGKTINKGETIYFDGKAYGIDSKAYKDRKEANQIFSHITANEKDYFDNFCTKNNI